MGGRVLVLAALTVAVVGQGDRYPATPLPAPRHLDPLVLCSGGFTVRKADLSTVYSVPSIVRFQEVLTNLGGWSANESDFRAPCTGAYFFTFHAVSVNGGDFTLALMKEGEYQVTAYGSKFDYQQGSNSALVFLNAGERVYLELQDGTLYEHPYQEAYTTFSGFLVELFK